MSDYLLEEDVGYLSRSTRVIRRCWT